MTGKIFDFLVYKGDVVHEVHVICGCPLQIRFLSLTLKIRIVRKSYLYEQEGDSNAYRADEGSRNTKVKIASRNPYVYMMGAIEFGL